MSTPAPHGSCLRVTARAKVNLVLSVGPRRPDGYHEIDTLIQAIDLADELEVRWMPGRRGIDLVVEGESAGPAQDNLVLRAARAFLDAAGLGPDTVGLKIRLTKRVPAGAGLGGGSSDAAATLRALVRLFPDVLSQARLSGLAAELGSDVPFFLCSSPLARARGRGERLDPLPSLPPRSGLVVMSSASMPTALAYSQLDRQRLAEGQEADCPSGAAAGPLGGASPWAGPTDWTDVAERATNDFEEVVATHLPCVRENLDALRSTGPALALLSGSGASSFAIYRREEEAAGAFARLAGTLDGRVLRIRTLSAWMAPIPFEP